MSTDRSVVRVTPIEPGVANPEHLVPGPFPGHPHNASEPGHGSARLADANAARGTRPLLVDGGPWRPAAHQTHDRAGPTDPDLRPCAA